MKDPESKDLTMSKILPRVEACNTLDDATYQAQYVPQLSVGEEAGVRLEFVSAAQLAKRGEENDRDKLNQCFLLLKSTSLEDYRASSMGWSTSDKRKEMKLPDMRYILVCSQQDDSVVGFTSFMITYEDGFEVVYIYEVHMSQLLRGKGLGTKLVRLVEEVGRRSEMSKVMLTVFVRNEAAYRFYQRLGYSIDDFSPQPRKLRNGVVKEPDYRILSKSLETGDGKEQH